MMSDNHDVTPLGKSVEDVEQDNQNRVNPPSRDADAPERAGQDTLPPLSSAGLASAAAWGGTGTGVGGTPAGTSAPVSPVPAIREEEGLAKSDDDDRS